VCTWENNVCRIYANSWQDLCSPFLSAGVGLAYCKWAHPYLDKACLVAREYAGRQKADRRQDLSL